MKISFNIIKDIVNFLEPFKTIDEKTILEVQTISNLDDTWLNVLDIVREKTNINIYELELAYQLAIIYIIRKHSIGDDINITYKCKCGNITESILSIKDFIEFNETDIELKHDTTITDILNTPIIDQWKLTTLNKPTTMKECIDIATEVRKCLPFVKFTQKTKCLFCGNETKHSLHSKELCIRSLSDHSITSLYQQINNLLVNQVSLHDINNMLIFEREIHLSLLQKRIDEHVEQQKKLLGL